MNAERITMGRTPNYKKKISQLQRKWKLSPGSVLSLNIQHDDWCAIFRGGICNCDPDIFLDGVKQE